MVLIAYMQCPIFKFERLFSPELLFLGLFKLCENGDSLCHCSFLSCPPLRNDASTHHNMAFVYIYQVSHTQCGGREEDWWRQWFVLREHGSELGCRLIFPHCRPIFHPVALSCFFYTVIQ